MALDTNIEWCDTTLNLQMGCNGCELWNPEQGIKHCYAGTLTERYAGMNSGFPEAFEKPLLFLDRIVQLKRMSNLIGKKRPDKPWLNDLPRLIFLNDMGDTFTESLELDWLAKECLPMVCPKGHKFPEVQYLKDDHRICCSVRGCQVTWKPKSALQIMAELPQFQFLILTKRPKRMAEFSKQHRLPDNVWPGTSITKQANVGRLYNLLEVEGGGPRWLSVEPLLDQVKLPWHGVWCRHHQKLEENCMDESSPCFRMQSEINSLIDWIIVGGESGIDARPMKPEWVEYFRDNCEGFSIPFFFKQWGGPMKKKTGRQINGVTYSQVPRYGPDLLGMKCEYWK